LDWLCFAKTPQSSFVLLFRPGPSVAMYQFPSRFVLFWVKNSRSQLHTDSRRKKRAYALKVFCSLRRFQLELRLAKPLRLDWRSLPLFRLHPFPLRRPYADQG
jgi:hypothetical protein